VNAREQTTPCPVLRSVARSLPLATCQTFTKKNSKRNEKLVASLESMKLIERHRPGDIASWVFSIGNQKVPKWACNVASEVIQSLHKQAADAKVQEFFRVHANGAHFQPVP
jgi:hypothetical protein